MLLTSCTCKNHWWTNIYSLGAQQSYPMHSYTILNPLKSVDSYMHDYAQDIGLLYLACWVSGQEMDSGSQVVVSGRAYRAEWGERMIPDGCALMDMGTIVKAVKPCTLFSWFWVFLLCFKSLRTTRKSQSLRYKDLQQRAQRCRCHSLDHLIIILSRNFLILYFLKLMIMTAVCFIIVASYSQGL